MTVQNNHTSESSKNHSLALTLGALGVVFGDIGTSPLYALRECFGGGHGIPVDNDTVLGVLSLIFWIVTLVVSIKYLLFVMRADNKGEGGNLSLLALVHPKAHERKTFVGTAAIYLGVVGAALLYGDGLITPAISVLSAVEGLKVVSPAFEHLVIPITTAILIGLFLVQSKGTSKIGKIFGPMILFWFLTLGILGVFNIIEQPGVVAALNPYYGIALLFKNPSYALHILGGVFLTVTGAEALYADMGHFGRSPIRYGWFAVALPGLMLNYFGQGALLLSNHQAIENPFFLMAPESLRIWLVLLSGVATVIASQAVITGAFSLTRQAVQLGYLPRLRIAHTSSQEIGQIYVGLVNVFLLIGTVWLVLEFKSSSNLASAYGIAVSTCMLCSTLLMAIVSRKVWGWRWAPVILVTGALLVIDLALWSSNILKIKDGGWFPILLAAIIFILMTTWRRGRQILAVRLRAGLLPLETFVAGIEEAGIVRVNGTAIFMSSNIDGVPPSLRHHTDCNKVLHTTVVLLMIETRDVPYLERYDRIQIQRLGHGFFRVKASYGFMESPNVPEVLSWCKDEGYDFDAESARFFVGTETIIPTELPGMALWREKLFAYMSRNAERPTEFFKVPRDRVIEIGLQVEI
jgi:KUP system potassium uptake protein